MRSHAKKTVFQLYLIRHGEPNPQAPIGVYDPVLSPTGRKQSIAIAEWLSKQPSLRTVYCSGLRRAIETAEIISNTFGIRPVQDPEFNEIEPFTDDDLEQLERFFSEQQWHGLREVHWTDYPGGLMFAREQNRIVAALFRVLAENGIERAGRVFRKSMSAPPGSNIVLVSHSGTMQCMLGALFDLASLHSVQMFWGDYAQVSAVQFIEYGSILLPKMAFYGNMGNIDESIIDVASME